MSPLFDSYGAIVIVIVGVIAAAALVLSISLAVQLRRLRRPFRGMAEIHERKGAERALEELLKGVDENREFIKGHAEELKRIYQMLAGCYCGMGLVKYNAFEDIGGMQSYSFCLLTRERSGFLLTNLVGRTSTRGYALDIRDGKPSRELSDEEREALSLALQELAPPGR